MRHNLMTPIVLVALLFPVVFAFGQTTGTIEIDSVVGGLGADSVLTGRAIIFRLRYVNPENHSWNISNGFVIYSPDGAIWSGPTKGDTIIGLIPSSNFDLAFATNDFPGSGSPRRDTVGIIGAAIYNQGLPPIFDGVPYAIVVGRLSASDAGKQICIDSCWFRTGGYWKWAASGGVNGYPTWGGPYCFTIVKCCDGLVGDANGIGGDEPSIGDIAVVIDAKYISYTCEGLIPCVAEADIDQSGGIDPTCDDISLGDISILIDYLFITGHSLGLPSCL